MAISNSDGSIVLTTAVDTSGIEKGLALSKEKIELFSKSTSSAFGKMFSSINGLVGKLIIASFFKRLAVFSDESAQAAIQTESSINRLIDVYGNAADVVGDFIDENAEAIGLSKSSAAQFASVYGNLFGAFADQAENAKLTNDYLRMTAVVASKTGRTVGDVQERIRSGLLGNTEAIEDLGIFVNVKTIEMTDSFKRMANGKSWAQLDNYTQQQIRSMAILEQATKKYGNEVAETTATVRAEYNAAWEDFSVTWGQVVNKVLIPILSVLTDILKITTTGLQTIFNLSDKILGNTDSQKDKISQSTENQKELTDEVNNTADATERALAGFDTLQILSTPTSKGEDSGNDDKKPNIIEGIENIEGDSSKIEKESNRFAEVMMGIVGGALAGIGILLLTKGQIGWGIGFLISGAFAFGVRMIAGFTEASDQGVGAVLAEIMQIIEEALPAVGIILLMKGQFEWGIGFIAAGAAMLGIEYFLTTEFSTDPIQNTLQKILGIVGTSLLAIGVILICFGVLPLGISMIVAGGVSLVTSIALNSNSIVEAIKGTIGAIMGVISAALLVLGIILLVTGAGIPLGLGLIAVGAVGLATPIALNWNWLVEKLKGVANSIGKTFSNLWNGIANGFKGMVNGIIGFANFWIDGLNLLLFPIRAIIIGASTAFGQNVSLDDIKIPHIPKLAKGAVLPANKPFLAMLGDQKNGTNVEAPLSTIEEAVENVLKRSGYTTKEEHYYLDETELMSIIYKLANGGKRIMGTNFATTEEYNV